MAKIVMIFGNSGVGKSTSLRNFKPEEVSVFNITSKDLPFKNVGKNKIPIKHNSDYASIAQGLINPTKRAYVIDDCGYLLSFSALNRATEKGFGKWNEMAENFFKMIKFIIEEVPNDVIVYLIMHEEIDDKGYIKPKTTGKMIDNILVLEGLFTIVLRAVHNESGYKFVTNGKSNTAAKTPIGMFEKAEIDNDLKLVDTTIREYYEIPPLGKRETKKV